MKYSPVEGTLVNQTHMQMKDYLDMDHLQAVESSNDLEKKVGWDAQVQNLKGIVFQYKRPVDDDGNLRFSVRNANLDELDDTQLKSMKSYANVFGRDVAYYALPPIRDMGNLTETLERTLFINAHDIPGNASVIKGISKDYCSDFVRKGGEPLKVHCSTSHDDKWDEEIPPSDVLGWEDLVGKLTECTIGFKIRKDGKPCYDSVNDNISLDELGEHIDQKESQHLIRIGGENLF